MNISRDILSQTTTIINQKIYEQSHLYYNFKISVTSYDNNFNKLWVTVGSKGGKNELLYVWFNYNNDNINGYTNVYTHKTADSNYYINGSSCNIYILYTYDYIKYYTIPNIYLLEDINMKNYELVEADKIDNISATQNALGIVPMRRQLNLAQGYYGYIKGYDNTGEPIIMDGLSVACFTLENHPEIISIYHPII